MLRCFLSLFCPDVVGDRLTQLVEWCDRYSPLASQDGCDGVVLDITGCAHLFGGERGLLIDLHRCLHQMKVKSRVAIADTWGAAWALVRYGNKFIVHSDQVISALDLLPVEALRLPIEIVLELRRLGLLDIAAVRKIPRTSLNLRFGPTLLRRLDQALGKAEDPLTPWRPPAPYRASRNLAEPISTLDSVEYVLRDLLKEICARLETNHLGSRHIELACYRVDGTVDRCEVRTSRPTRAVTHLMRLFNGRLEGLRADFGFEAFTLSVLSVEALDPVQLSLTQPISVEDEESFNELIDRLGMKLGFQEVNRIRVCESLLPAHSVEFRPAIESAIAGTEWPSYRIRPIRLINPPMRIEVSILIPGESPVQFFIGQRKHRIVRSEGPERLTSEWWRERNSRYGTRDYYRIEDDHGLRFWIFHESGQWFLHGHLP